MQALRVLNTIPRSGQYRHSASREEYFASPVFSQVGRARVETSGFLTAYYCNCIGGLSPTA
jgi:hypothetical protein